MTARRRTKCVVAAVVAAVIFGQCCQWTVPMANAAFLTPHKLVGSGNPRRAFASLDRSAATAALFHGHGSSTLQQLSSFMERSPGESDDAHYRRITTAASDPALFEQMVLQSTKVPSSLPSTRSNIATHVDSNAAHAPAPSTNRTGYVRAEEWEAQELQRKKRGELTWEERVQFEGQMYGNRVQQNDILRHNLHK
jgi:hypothetical protein